MHPGDWGRGRGCRGMWGQSHDVTAEGNLTVGSSAQVEGGQALASCKCSPSPFSPQGAETGQMRQLRWFLNVWGLARSESPGSRWAGEVGPRPCVSDSLGFNCQLSEVPPGPCKKALFWKSRKSCLLAVNKLVLGGRACLGTQVGGRVSPSHACFPSGSSLAPQGDTGWGGREPQLPSSAHALLWQVKVSCCLGSTPGSGAGQGPAVHIWSWPGAAHSS